MTDDNRELVAVLVPPPVAEHFDQFVDDLEGARHASHTDIFRTLHPKVRGTLLAALLLWTSTENKEETPESLIEKRADGPADDSVIMDLMVDLGFDKEQWEKWVAEHDGHAADWALLLNKPARTADKEHRIGTRERVVEPETPHDR